MVATLRRCLGADDPATFIPAFGLVDPLLRGSGPWVRPMAYLAAGLWASAVRQGKGPPLALPAGMRRVGQLTGSSSIEHRFNHLLAADQEELPMRLRPVIRLIASNGLNIHWPSLLDDLLRWDHPDRFVQIRWSRVFWDTPITTTIDT